MSNTLTLRPAHANGDSRLRSDALRRCLERVLRQTLDATSLVTLQVSSSLLLDAPVVVERLRGAVPPCSTGQLAIRLVPLPPTHHVSEATLWISATTVQALAEAAALPTLLSSVMDSELGRHVAEGTARGALEMANRDPATGLGNRRAWMQALQVEAGRTLRSGRPLTVLILDVDGLKRVNDTHGHAAGDELIGRTAAALRASRRATDQVCRLGGDEFGITAPDTDAVQAQLLAARVRRCLQESRVPASLGWAVTTGAGDVENLWQRADAAMYADKRTRR